MLFRASWIASVLSPSMATASTYVRSARLTVYPAGHHAGFEEAFKNETNGIVEQRGLHGIALPHAWFAILQTAGTALISATVGTSRLQSYCDDAPTPVRASALTVVEQFKEVFSPPQR